MPDVDIAIVLCDACRGIGRRKALGGWRLMPDGTMAQSIADWVCKQCNGSGKMEEETYHYG